MERDESQFELIIKPLPCPWCGSDTKNYVYGWYSEGFTSHIECSSRNECGVRGPTKRSRKPRLDDEYFVRDNAAEAWNTVVKLSFVKS